jgi:hypothetical protein
MKRLRLIAFIVFVLLAGMLAFYHFHNREPSYQGLTLTEWLEGNQGAALYPMYNESNLVECTNAVKQMGTNAIPFLLEKLNARDNAFERHLRELLEAQSLIDLHLLRPEENHVLGCQGFGALGKDAMSAVPALDALIKDQSNPYRYEALISLIGIRPEKDIFLPILLRTLHDKDFTIRGNSANALQKLFPEEAEKAGVYDEFPSLKPGGTNSVLNAPKR